MSSPAPATALTFSFFCTGTSGIIGYEPNFKAFCKEVMFQYARDGIQYFEARINFWVKVSFFVLCSQAGCSADLFFCTCTGHGRE